MSYLRQANKSLRGCKLAFTCMGIFSSFCLLLWRMTPFLVARINGFVLETGVSSLFLWRKPHPRKTETSTTYRIVTATSIHFTCTNQELEQHKSCIFLQFYRCNKVRFNELCCKAEIQSELCV